MMFLRKKKTTTTIKNLQVDVPIPRRKHFSKSQKCSKDTKAFCVRPTSQGMEWGGKEWSADCINELLTRGRQALQADVAGSAFVCYTPQHGFPWRVTWPPSWLQPAWFFLPAEAVQLMPDGFRRTPVWIHWDLSAVHPHPYPSVSLSPS